MVRLVDGASGGAVFGTVAAIVFAVVFLVERTVLDLVGPSPPGLADVAFGFVFIGFFVLLVAVAVGLVGGILLGAASVPLVNHWRWSVRSLMAVVAVLVGVGGLVAFPSVALGDGALADVEEVLSLKVLPATIAAVAGAAHVGVLHRRRQDGLSGPAAPGAVPSARPRGAASDG